LCHLIKMKGKEKNPEGEEEGKDRIRLLSKWSVIGSIIGALVGACPGLFLVEYISSEVDTIWRIGSAISITMVFLVIGLLVGEGLKAILKRKLEFNEITDEIKKCVKEITNPLVNQAALFSIATSSLLEETLKPIITGQKGDTKWIVAKFISYKLSKDSTSLEGMCVKLDDHDEFSKLAGRMIPECEHSLYLTNPFDPKEWWEGHHLSPIIREQVRNREMPKMDDLNSHINKIYTARAKDKKRINIFTKKAYESYVIECVNDDHINNERLIFQDIEDKVVGKDSNMIIIIEDLLERRPGLKEYNLERFDYGIYDKSVLLIYDKVRRDLYLKFSIPDVLLSIFEFQNFRDKRKDLGRDIEKKKRATSKTT